MKAFFIDSTKREIREVNYSNFRDIQTFVGGTFTMVPTDAIGRGDVMFVDDEGLLKTKTGFFMLPDSDYPLAGNALVVGKESDDDNGDTFPPTSTIETLSQVIQFKTPAQVASWGKGNASEPAVVFYSIDDNGKVSKPSVLARMGKLFENVDPKNEPEA